MIHEIEYNGKNLSDFGIFIAEDNLHDSAGYDVEYVEVPGRSGDLSLSKNRGKAFDLQYKCHILKEFSDNVTELKNFLNVDRADHKLVDSMRPGEYLNASFSNSVKVSPRTVKEASFTLTFHCQPQRWLTAGDTEVSITSGQILNGGDNTQIKGGYPLLFVQGTGNVSVNDTALKVTKSYSDGIYIDSLIADCYNGTANLNGYVEIDEFPMLKAGDNTITFDSGMTVTVKPRWYHE